MYLVQRAKEIIEKAGYDVSSSTCQRGFIDVIGIKQRSAAVHPRSSFRYCDLSQCRLTHGMDHVAARHIRERVMEVCEIKWRSVGIWVMVRHRMSMG